jgi:peptidyl-prolyl cis-trans isomerase A (cyclophilin A)/peptidyl-prolyl cis-trans isomerase B (cyclophilin B)
MRQSALALFLAASGVVVPFAAGAANPQVEIKTTMGAMTLELYADKAPKTVENFIAYANAGHYNGTIFHRVIPGFMIQGGGYTKTLDQKPTRPALEHEGAACAHNDAGTISMARTSDPHSATSQFFINVVNNAKLNHTQPPQGWGYCAFGRVTKGMDVAQKIVAVPTSAVGQHANLPNEPILIESVTVTSK